MIVVNRKFVPKVARAITIWPFIFFRAQEDITPTVLTHEKIHLQQQKETLVIMFYLIYGIHFLVNLVKYRGDWYKAYLNICFEKEAFIWQETPDYLEVRKPFSWLTLNSSK